MLASETLLNLARLIGIASGGAAGITGYLKDKATRDRVRAAIARGDKILLGVMGGWGHYVTLLAIDDHGIVVHDPAGARCEYEGEYFLSSGERTEALVGAWMWKLTRPGWPAAARRRLALNPRAREVVDQLIEAGRAKRTEQQAIVKQLATGERLEMGANNVYDLGDLELYRIDVRVEMHR